MLASKHCQELDRAAIRQRADACELVYLTVLAEQVVKEDIPRLLEALDQAEQQREELLAAARDVVAQFERINAHQRALLVEGQTLESASETWATPEDPR